MKRFKREDEAPISTIVDLLFHSAVDEIVFDIHIEPGEADSLVRFRIDGILHDVLNFSKTMHSQVVSRIKVLANLRTDEHSAPQDGKVRIKHDEQSVDIRISIIPMVEGEKVVMCLLVSHFKLFSFADLGMDGEKSSSSLMGKNEGSMNDGRVTPDQRRAKRGHGLLWKDEFFLNEG